MQDRAPPGFRADAWAAGPARGGFRTGTRPDGMGPDWVSDRPGRARAGFGRPAIRAPQRDSAFFVPQKQAFGADLGAVRTRLASPDQVMSVTPIAPLC